MRVLSTALLAIDALVFVFLSMLHVHWAFGGKWAFEGTVPRRADAPNKKLFVPGKAASLVVAAGLFAFAVACVVRIASPSVVARGAIAAIGALFLLRAIGDFRYVGISKRVRGTVFSRNDDRIFIPLCAFLGGTSVWSFFL